MSSCHRKLTPAVQKESEKVAKLLTNVRIHFYYVVSLHINCEHYANCDFP